MNTRLSEARILWLDLETTGLDPYADSVLEIGCVVTDGALKELGRKDWVARLPARFRDGRCELDDYVRDMHQKNGLLTATQHAPSLHEIQPLVVAWLTQQGVNKKTPLAGNSVGDFDRHFLRAELPNVNAMISHRSINVSTLRLLFGLYAPEVELPSQGKDVAHRSLADCDASIKDFREVMLHLEELENGFAFDTAGTP